MTRPDDVEVLLFDLGGVVIQIDFGRALRRWSHDAGLDVDAVGRRFVVGAEYEAHERGLISFAEYCAHLREILSVDLTDETLLAGWVDIYLDVVPGMPQLLRDLADRFRLFAFTNTNAAHQAIWSTRFAKDLAVFDHVFASSDIGLRKPDREAFTFVTHTIGVDPSKIVFFDDGEENVSGAKAADLRGYVATSAQDVRRALAELTGVGL